MYTGDEGVIEGADAVGCQKEDALAIFHGTKEAYATFVSIVMVFGLIFVDMKAVRNGRDT